MSASSHDASSVADAIDSFIKAQRDLINVAVQRHLGAPPNTTFVNIRDFAGVKCFEPVSDAWVKFGSVETVSSASIPTKTSKDAPPAPNTTPVCDQALDHRWYTEFAKEVSERRLLGNIRDSTVVDYERFRQLAMWFRDLIGPSGQKHLRDCMSLSFSSTDIRTIEASILTTLDASIPGSSDEVLIQANKNDYGVEQLDTTVSRLHCMSVVALSRHWETLTEQWSLKRSAARNFLIEYSRAKGRVLERGKRMTTLGHHWLTEMSENFSDELSSEDSDQAKRRR